MANTPSTTPPATTRPSWTWSRIVNAVDRLEAFLAAFDATGTYVNQAPYGEPQLGRHGLYPSVNSPQNWGLSDDSAPWTKGRS